MNDGSQSALVAAEAIQDQKRSDLSPIRATDDLGAINRDRR